MNELCRDWITSLRDKCRDNEYFIRLLDFMESHNPRIELWEGDAVRFTNNESNYTYGEFYIGSALIRINAYEQDGRKMLVRVGADYVGHWDKFYNSILDAHFPAAPYYHAAYHPYNNHIVSKKEYMIFENQLLKIINDKSGGKNYYRKHRGDMRSHTKVDRRYAGGYYGKKYGF